MIHIYVFIVTAYIPAAKGNLCSKNDKAAVNYLEHCKEAAKQLKRNFTEEETYYCRGCPDGCFSNPDDHVYFNARSTYKQTILYNNKTQICYAAGDFINILLYPMII